MSVQSHIRELQKKHAILSDQVERAQRHPSADDLELREMKREKLRLKEKITRLGH